MINQNNEDLIESADVDEGTFENGRFIHLNDNQRDIRCQLMKIADHLICKYCNCVITD
ncbi:hypothetical protein SNEBB_007729, partial [Seison nebaliae]